MPLALFLEKSSRDSLDLWVLQSRMPRCGSATKSRRQRQLAAIRAPRGVRVPFNTAVMLSHGVTRKMSRSIWRRRSSSNIAEWKKALDLNQTKTWAKRLRIPRWLFGISEPSTVSTKTGNHSEVFEKLRVRIETVGHMCLANQHLSVRWVSQLPYISMDFIRSAFFGFYVPVVNCLKLPALTLRVEVENCLQDTCSTPRRIEVPEKTFFWRALLSAKTKLRDVWRETTTNTSRFETWRVRIAP